MFSTCYKNVNRLWPLSYFSVKLWVTLQGQTSKSKTTVCQLSLSPTLALPAPGGVCVKGVRGVFAVSVAVWFVHFGGPRHACCQSILVLLASEWRTVLGGISGPGQRKPEPSPCPASSLAPRPAWTQAKDSEKWHWAIWTEQKPRDLELVLGPLGLQLFLVQLPQQPTWKQQQQITYWMPGVVLGTLYILIYWLNDLILSTLWG